MHLSVFGVVVNVGDDIVHSCLGARPEGRLDILQFYGALNLCSSPPPHPHLPFLLLEQELFSTRREITSDAFSQRRRRAGSY